MPIILKFGNNPLLLTPPVIKWKCFSHSPHNYVVVEAYLLANRCDFVLVLPLDSDSKLGAIENEIIHKLLCKSILYFIIHI